jgi:hypothetical protein
MEISPETLERITQPLVDAQTFAEAANEMWKTLMKGYGVGPN